MDIKRLIAYCGANLEAAGVIWAAIGPNGELYGSPGAMVSIVGQDGGQKADEKPRAAPPPAPAPRANKFAAMPPEETCALRVGKQVVLNIGMDILTAPEKTHIKPIIAKRLAAIEYSSADTMLVQFLEHSQRTGMIATIRSAAEDQMRKGLPPGKWVRAKVSQSMVDGAVSAIVAPMVGGN